MTISKELLDELLSGVEKPEDFFGDLISRVTDAVLEEV